MNALTIDQTATLLQVTSRTIALWENGESRIPYSAFKLLRCLANGEFVSDVWEGWRVRGDTLYTPSGRAFKPYELYYLSNYMSIARYWLADCKSKLDARQVFHFKPRLRLVTSTILDAKENLK